MAAAKCRVLPGSTLGIDNERNWLGKRGYDDKGVRVLCDDDERDVADEKVASEDPFLTQLEIAASMKELATSLLDNLPDNQEAAPTTTADENIEDIVSDLLSALKTDQGRVEFRQLASKQALKAQQQRLQQLGDVSQTNQSATTTTVGNARAFAELLCVDASSVMIGANPR